MQPLANLRTAVARDLSAQFGDGHWSAEVSDAAARRAMRGARVIVAHHGAVLVGTCRLTTKKPWAIDRRYFVNSLRPYYLTDMAVDPDWQRCGVGRAIVAAAQTAVVASGGTAIRLDAYDGLAGAGPFYERCGFVSRGSVIYRSVPLLYFEWVVPRLAGA